MTRCGEGGALGEHRIGRGRAAWAHHVRKGDSGVALLTALIITLVVFMLISSSLYVITSSTNISGAGKRYATASEAADGAVEVMKEAIGLIMQSEPVDTLPLRGTTDLAAVVLVGGSTEVFLDLPAGLFSRYTARITVERLYAKMVPGSRIEFPPQSSTIGSMAVYFRISTAVSGPSNAKAETTALYRYVR